MQRLVKLKAEALDDGLDDSLAEQAKTLIDLQIKVKAEGVYDA